ncbi:portal protein [Caudoviricetes sp.]|nr:portal protein [Caudoviricetes sp.]
MRIPLLSSLLERKFDPTFIKSYLYSLGRPTWMDRDIKTFSEEGYKKNAIVFKCIDKTAKAASRIPICLHGADGEEIEEHPLLDLLKRPNPMNGGARFFEAVFAFYRLAGNSYIYATEAKNPSELWVLRPDRMRAVPGAKGIVEWQYQVGSSEPLKFPVDPVTGESQVRHWKTFNPLNDIYGMSPLEAAAWSVDQHNDASAWNKALLQNGCKPSGAFVVGSQGGVSTGTLSDSQYERLKSQMDEKMSGSRNAGKPLILEGGLDWKEMGLSPKEMDWLDGKHTSAREICHVLDTPPQLLGIPGDNTYSNYSEARLSFYEDSIIPLVDSLLDELNAWLVPMFDGLEGAYLKMDKDDIDALSPRREAKWAAVGGAQFLTINEKRKALDYEPFETHEADEIFVPSGLLPLKGSMDAPDPAGTLPEGQDPPDATGKPGDTLDEATKAIQQFLEAGKTTKGKEPTVDTKYNPYHGEDGRFTSGDSEGARVSLRERDRAVAHEAARQAPINQAVVRPKKDAIHKSENLKESDFLFESQEDIDRMIVSGGKISDGYGMAMKEGRLSIRQNVPYHSLEKMLEEDTVKNGYETGTGTGAGDKRGTIEKSLYDGVSEDPSSRPKYAFMSMDGHHPSDAARFGDATIVYRDHVIDRSTVMRGDTLQYSNRIDGLPVPSPSNARTPSKGSFIARSDLVGRAPTFEDIAKEDNYLEVQMHGRITPSADWKEVIFSGNGPSTALKRMLDERGITYSLSSLR